MQQQSIETPQVEQPAWEAPELVKGDVNSATLSNGIAFADGGPVGNNLS